ncbi:hypothetical protein IWW48_003520 [Coemansia sp. RSA 1200]|nr:hypothetical protein IWW48_003520 [Coemansia sp. RSA 1200]
MYHHPPKSHSGGSASGGSRLKERRSITQRRGNPGLASHRQSGAGVGLYPLKSPLGGNTAPVSFGNIQAVGAGDTNSSISRSAFPLNALAHWPAEHDISDGNQTRPSYAAGKDGKNDNNLFTFRISDKPDGADNEIAVDRRSPTVGGGIGFGTTGGADPLVVGVADRMRRPSGSAAAAAGRGPIALVPDPLMPSGECAAHIDRLLEYVRQKHRECTYTAHMALASPTASNTPTRLDPTPPRTPTPTHLSPAIRTGGGSGSPGGGSTVSTVSVGADSNHSASALPAPSRDSAAGGNDGMEDPYSPRRRAVTMDHRLHSGRRRQDAATMAATGRTPSGVRAKLEELRARRLARLEEEERALIEGRSPTSPIPLSPPALDGSSFKPRANTDIVSPGRVRRSGNANVSGSGWETETATVCTNNSSGTEDPDFFDNKDVVAMFRELPLPFKELDWEKQVYYYHVTQSSTSTGADRSPTKMNKEENDDVVDIRDCRAECLGDLLGEKLAARVVARSARREAAAAAAPASVLRRRRMSEDNNGDEDGDGGSTELDAADAQAQHLADVDAWLDFDSDADEHGAEAERSFDWSRDGFGYMEFRRSSRPMLAQPSLLSPAKGVGLAGAGTTGTGAAPAAAAAIVGAHGVSPLSRQLRQSPLHVPSISAVATVASPTTPLPRPRGPLARGALHTESPPSPAAQSAADKPQQRRRNSGNNGGRAGGMMTQMRDRAFGRGGKNDDHLLSLIKESDAVTESDDGWQILSHPDGDAGTGNAALPAPEQQLRDIASENQRLERQIARAREAVSALARVICPTAVG